MPGEITAGLKFGEAVAKLWHEWIKSKERRYFKKAIEASEKYIQVNEKSGDFKKITKVKQLQLLRHYSKRFWRYN